jgi:uncharacterized protein YbjT (DUF2867 family)
MILVTGATGKVGRHLVAGLLAEGAPVRALTRHPETAGLPAAAEVVSIDPARPDTIAAAVAGTTAVFVNATAAGRPLRLQELPAEVFRQAATAYMPAPAVDDLLRYLAYYVGRTAEMAPDLPALTGRPAITFADWAAAHASRFA